MSMPSMHTNLTVQTILCLPFNYRGRLLEFQCWRSLTFYCPVLAHLNMVNLVGVFVGLYVPECVCVFEYKDSET